MESLRLARGRSSLEAPGGHRDAIIIMMRTTLNLPDEVYEVVRSFATTKRISMGDALAELVRKGLNPSPRFRSKSAFPSFEVSADATPITLDHTLAIEDEF